MANGASEEDQVGGDLDLGLQLLAAQQHAPGQALTWPQRRVLRLAASVRRKMAGSYQLSSITLGS